MSKRTTGVNFGEYSVADGQLFLKDGGNVGIGTTSPGGLLHLSASGTDGPQVRLTNAGGGSTWYMSKRTTGVNFGEYSVADGQLFLKDGGNVGIGTTSPTEKLEVYRGDILANLGHVKFTQLSAPAALTATVQAVTGNVDVGPHSYRVTFIAAAGETEGGTTSAIVTTSSGHQQVALSNIPTGAAGIVTGRKVYRIGVNQSVFQHLTTINDNTTTTYTDNLSDESLGASLLAVNGTSGALIVGGVRQVQIDPISITFHPQEIVWDPDAYNRSFTRNIKVLTSPSNEYGAYFEVTCAATSSPESYEKMALFSQAFTLDPSSSTICRDAVGADPAGNHQRGK